MIMRKIIFLFVFLVTGCATAPEGSIPFSEVVIPEPNEGESVLVFYRLYTPPMINNMRVSIDGEQVVELPNNSFSYIKIKPGKLNLKTSWSAWALTPSRKQDLQIEPKETFYIQLNSSTYTPTGIELGSSGHNIQNKTTAEHNLVECCKYIESKPL